MKQVLEADPPYGAEVDVRGPAKAARAAGTRRRSRRGSRRRWREASQDAFGKPPAYMGEGGTIPFMGMLGEKFPETQFVITGVLGPHSNAHGPNEFLHIPTGKRVTMAVARLIAAHFTVREAQARA